MTFQRIYKVAVVGCGAFAQAVHLPNIVKNPRLCLAVCCDSRLEIAQECTHKFNAKRAEANWRKVIDDDEIDLIILATHTELRGELIIAALHAGKPVYTEKPLSNSQEEMLNIYNAFQKTKVPVCVGHNRRSSPAILELKRLVDRILNEQISGLALHSLLDSHRKRITEEAALQILMRVNDDARSWKSWIFSDEQGILFAEMVHYIDLALWFNPSAPVRIMVEGSQRGNFTILLRFADGSLTTMQHSMVGHFDYPKDLMEVSCRNVSLALDEQMELRQIGLMDEPGIQYFPLSSESGWIINPGMTGYMSAMRTEHEFAVQEKRMIRHPGADKGHAQHLDRFLNHLEGKGENPASIESAIMTSRVTLKALESARNGLPIPIQSEDWDLPEFKKPD